MKVKGFPIGLFAFAIIVGAAAGYWFTYQKSKEVTAVYDVKRAIRYAFTLYNPTSQPMEHVEFFTYVPVAQTSTQQCCDEIKVSHSYKLERDAVGNQVARVHLELLPPYTTRIVNFSASVRLAEQSNSVDEEDVSAYLGKEAMVELDDPQIQELARKLKRNTTQDTVRAIYDWLVNNIEYAGYLRDDLGASYALQHRKGDCTEYMYLFMALARLNNIPARGVAGYVVDRDSILDPDNHHNWAEFYRDGAWYVVDAQKGIFMEQQSDFVAMRTLSRPGSQERSNAHRFWYNAPELEVRMN